MNTSGRSCCSWFSWFSAWVLLPCAEMILAFLIVNNFGKARMLKFYRETVRARARACLSQPVALIQSLLTSCTFAVASATAASAAAAAYGSRSFRDAHGKGRKRELAP